MAAAATDGQPEPHGARRLQPVGDIFNTIFLVDDAGLAGDHVVAVEAGGDDRVEGLGVGSWREEIAGELPDRELIVGNILIEGADHPVAPGPRLPRVVAEITV